VWQPRWLALEALEPGGFASLAFAQVCRVSLPGGRRVKYQNVLRLVCDNLVSDVQFVMDVV